MLDQSHLSCAIAIMGKAPQNGRTKTRLASAVGTEGATMLAAAFLRDTTANVLRAARDAAIQGFVAYSPAGSEALLEPLLAPGTTLLLADGVGVCTAGVHGFGRCLLQTIERLLEAGHAAACVLNADGPTPADRLSRPGSQAARGARRSGGARRDE